MLGNASLPPFFIIIIIDVSIIVAGYFAYFPKSI